MIPKGREAPGRGFGELPADMKRIISAIEILGKFAQGALRLASSPTRSIIVSDLPPEPSARI
jgi:hypothetical protein